jgi:hypothetical protein
MVCIHELCMFVGYGLWVWWNYILQGCLLDVRDKGAVRIEKFTPLRLLNEEFVFESVPLIVILCFYFCYKNMQFLYVF